MEFISISGKNHILTPIGYNVVRKTIRRGAKVRSAVEQFAIHTTAYTFRSPLIYMPQPIAIESSRAYTMQHILEGTVIPACDYFKHPSLFIELHLFKLFMMQHNYWPHGYNIIQYKTVYILYDFSLFGIIDRDYIKFPKIASVYTLEEADAISSAWMEIPVLDFYPCVSLTFDANLEKIEQTFMTDV